MYMYDKLHTDTLSDVIIIIISCLTLYHKNRIKRKFYIYEVKMSLMR